MIMIIIRHDHWIHHLARWSPFLSLFLFAGDHLVVLVHLRNVLCRCHCYCSCFGPWMHPNIDNELFVRHFVGTIRTIQTMDNGPVWTNKQTNMHAYAIGVNIMINEHTSLENMQPTNLTKQSNKESNEWMTFKINFVSLNSCNSGVGSFQGDARECQWSILIQHGLSRSSVTTATGQAWIMINSSSRSSSSSNNRQYRRETRLCPWIVQAGCRWIRDELGSTLTSRTPVVWVLHSLVEPLWLISRSTARHND